MSSDKLIIFSHHLNNMPFDELKLYWIKKKKKRTDRGRRIFSATTL